MSPEGKSLVFMMATAAKQIHTTNMEVVQILPMVVDGIRFSGQRLQKLEGGKAEDKELGLLYYLAEFPYHASLTPTVLNLLWETCQTLLDRKE